MLEIRKITKDDREKYTEMARAFYRSGATLYVIPDENIAAAFEEMMRSECYLLGYIFEWDGKTAGFGMLSRTYSQEAGGMVTWVEEIFVLPEYRGRGIGTEFLEFADNMPDTARIRLEAEPDNERAIDLYLRMGYKPLDYTQYVKEKVIKCMQ